nr:twin-arginine translocase TatA/TatE family subunit [uncultured Flavobacterium sp.]
MFGIGGGEIFFIILVALMLFGSDKIPDIARTLGKGMAQLKNATNDIKNEIQKSAEANGLNDLNPMNQLDMTSDITKEIDKAKEEIEDMTGPIKRQL